MSIPRLNFRLAAITVALFLVTPSVNAQDAESVWEGEWGGAGTNNVTAQVIISGGMIIGFFWRNDYLDTSGLRFSVDFHMLSFAFPGGNAELVLEGNKAALTINERGRSTTNLLLQKD